MPAARWQLPPTAWVILHSITCEASLLGWQWNWLFGDILQSKKFPSLCLGPNLLPTRINMMFRWVVIAVK